MPYRYRAITPKDRLSAPAWTRDRVLLGTIATALGLMVAFMLIVAPHVARDPSAVDEPPTFEQLAIVH